MKRIYILIVLSSIAQISVAQKFSIKGQVTDSTKSALPSSTVMLLSQKDSTLVNFGVSDKSGLFEIKNVSVGDYFLRVTFVGYETYQKRISAVGAGGDINVGSIKMIPQDRQLEELVIKGEKAPVTVKRDTM